MGNLIKSNKLLATSDRYTTLINRINTAIIDQDAQEVDKNYSQAAQIGMPLWEDLKELIKLLGAKCVYDIGYETGYDLLYWATTYCTVLEMASKKDKYFSDVLFSFCHEYVAMHATYTDKDVRNLGNIRCALANCYYDQGEFDTCDQLFEEWLTAEPEWGCGWIGWADCYSFYTHGKSNNLEKAKRIIQRGLASQQVDNRAHVLDRLEKIQECLDQENISIMK